MINSSLFSTTRVDLNWTASPDTGVTYNVYRSTTNDFITANANLIASEVVGTSLSDTSAQPDTTYFYGVTARTANTESSDYVQTRITTTFDSAPTNLVASVADDANIDLWWRDNSGNETSFVIQESPNGTTGWATLAGGTLPPNQTFFQVGGLQAETNYFFRVQATFPAAPVATTQVAPATTQATGATTTFIAVIAGRLQDEANLVDIDQQGVIKLTVRLRGQGYNAHLYTTWGPNRTAREDGSGKIYDDIVAAANAGIHNLAVVGYSHGGGVTYQVINRLNINHHFGGLTMNRAVYSAYIDAYTRPGGPYPFLGFPENHYPNPSEHHDNWFACAPGVEPLRIVNGAVNMNALSRADEQALPENERVNHLTIDDRQYVQDGIYNSIRTWAPIP